MGSLADQTGNDVEIHRRPLNDTIYVDSGSAPAETLLTLLDHLGFERRTAAIYVWHEVPKHLPEMEQKKLATRAIPTLLTAGYRVNIHPDLFDEATYRNAVAQLRTQRATPTAAGTPAPAPATHAARSRA
ncbi:hypothetical protein ACH4UT_29085 [Streptomyces sp. NPDC020799]|uniref:hypothetical protein n=1 Tax=Streptomyces sp. NPDC020799 TaxID=3365091 RepID=UPI0037913C14